MTQPQLSVRERAREMFDAIFSQQKTAEGRSYLYDKEAECSVNPLIMKDFIDQIITLAQEENRKRIVSDIEKMNYKIVVPSGMAEYYAEKGVEETRNAIISLILKQ